MIKLSKIEPVRLLFGTLESVGGLRGRLVPADADTNSGGGELWETVFEGEIVSDAGAFPELKVYADTIQISQTLGLGDVVRITDSENSWVLPVYKAKPSKPENVEYIFGNSELYGNESELTMYTDCDYCGNHYMTLFGKNWCYLYTRTPGTYKIKIEKLVTTE